MSGRQSRQRQGEMSDSDLLRSWQMRQKGDDELDVFVGERVSLASGGGEGRAEAAGDAAHIQRGGDLNGR